MSGHVDQPSVVDAVLGFNRARDPKLVRLKYRRIEKDSLAFLRGTDHRFATLWARLAPPDVGPSASGRAARLASSDSAAIADWSVSFGQARPPEIAIRRRVLQRTYASDTDRESYYHSCLTGQFTGLIMHICTVGNPAPRRRGRARAEGGSSRVLGEMRPATVQRRGCGDRFDCQRR